MKRFVALARHWCSIQQCVVWVMLAAVVLADNALGQSSSQSDPAAVQAFQNFIVQSGGATAWAGLTSAKEVFSIASSRSANPLTTALLDDWSLATTRYRRKTQGDTHPPVDHNGNSTFSVNMDGSTRTMPEFDQPRILASHLPAAAAAIVLQRPEYMLKMSTSQACAVGSICVGVYRIGNSNPHPVLEELWTISVATGLPEKVSCRAVLFGTSGNTWSEASFLKYAQQGNLVVPVSIETTFMGRQQTWTFVSLDQNPGFNVAKFDNEVGQ